MTVDDEVADDNMLKKPCNDCPFRKDSLPGWLGASTPEEFMETTFSEAPMPCHQTVDYEDEHWKDDWESGWQTGEHTGSMCAGAAIMFANQCKVPRTALIPRRKPDRESVFAWQPEFIAHHRQLGRGSWSHIEENNP